MNADRIKEIQNETAYPESRSVQKALMKVWNECEQNPKRVSVDAVVIGEQHLIRATVWYMEHQEHVTSVVSEAEQKYPPSDEYDVRNPNVWKPQHWRWFIEKYL